MQNQSKTVKQLNKEISVYLHRYFVTNTYAMAVQMKDGKYATKYLPVSEFLIEEMLNQGGSVGCYQQCYKSDMVKWICFDFDCPDKENPDLDYLYKKNVEPLQQILDEYKVNYLTEYSGRRGIHVWIIFSHLIKKDKAFQILSFFRNKLLVQIGELCYANLDLFPATNISKGNTVGKQVKMPLSCHRAGGRSWLCERDFIKPDLMDEVGFLAQQLDILSRYNVNDYQRVCESIGVNDEELIVRLKYRKYEINNDISLSIWDTIEILSETKVYAAIFQRLMQGQALRNDWLVVMGTFSPLNDGGAFVTELYSIFPNYDVKKTSINIKKYREAYYPATFEYLYQIYGIEMEKNIDKNDTGFSYLLKRKGIVPKVDESNIIYNKKRDDAISIGDTVKKEIKYVLDNDEVINISVWNDLNRIKATELFRLDKIVENLLGAEEYSFSWKPLAYVYQREESESKKRELVTLGALDRVLTTQIALILQKKLKSFWNSYSYNVSFGSREDIFYNWYSSWGEYINQIKTFMEVPFMENYEVFVIDLKGFYDHVDFLSVYSIFENELDISENNLFRFLIDYNDTLMRGKFDNRRIGVPQGPAYARIIAEMYLDKILSRILSRFSDKKYYFYRYVDDIIVFAEPGNNAREIYDVLCNELVSFGLPINEDKTQWYGSIKSCSEVQRKEILRKDKFTYDLQNTEFRGYMTLAERNRDVAIYLSENEFDVSNLGLFFNRHVYFEASEQFFIRYTSKIMESTLGRGNAFRRFYEYVFTQPFAAELVLDNGYLYSVPLNGINFGNLLGVIYLLIQRKQINEDVFGRIQEEYLAQIDEDSLFEEYSTIVKALLKIRYKVDEEC